MNRKPNDGIVRRWNPKGGRNRELYLMRNAHGVQYLYWRPGAGRFDDEWTMWVYDPAARLSGPQQLMDPCEVMRDAPPALLVIEGRGGVVYRRGALSKGGASPARRTAYVIASITSPARPPDPWCESHPWVPTASCLRIFPRGYADEGLPALDPGAVAQADELLALIGVATPSEDGIRAFLAAKEESFRVEGERRNAERAARNHARAAEAERRAERIAANAAAFGAVSLPPHWNGEPAPDGYAVWRTGDPVWMRRVFATRADLDAWCAAEWARAAEQQRREAERVAAAQAADAAHAERAALAERLRQALARAVPEAHAAEREDLLAFHRFAVEFGAVFTGWRYRADSDLPLWTVIAARSGQAPDGGRFWQLWLLDPQTVRIGRPPKGPGANTWPRDASQAALDAALRDWRDRFNRPVEPDPRCRAGTPLASLLDDAAPTWTCRSGR